MSQPKLTPAQRATNRRTDPRTHRTAVSITLEPQLLQRYCQRAVAEELPLSRVIERALVAHELDQTPDRQSAPR